MYACIFVGLGDNRTSKVTEPDGSPQPDPDTFARPGRSCALRRHRRNAAGPMEGSGAPLECLGIPLMEARKFFFLGHSESFLVKFRSKNQAHPTISTLWSIRWFYEFPMTTNMLFCLDCSDRTTHPCTASGNLRMKANSSDTPLA